ncbi:hypothetical protein BC628DRAFT_378861 [Trametes gibbosa]|nr:hypothetical protein BC628DRAFT_378861 [Trametes gibbosa]
MLIDGGEGVAAATPCAATEDRAQDDAEPVQALRSESRIAPSSGCPAFLGGSHDRHRAPYPTVENLCCTVLTACASRVMLGAFSTCRVCACDSGRSGLRPEVAVAVRKPLPKCALRYRGDHLPNNGRGEVAPRSTLRKLAVTCGSCAFLPRADL